jgi:hypothetical protein
MVQDVCEALASSFSDGGNASSFSSHFCVLVQANWSAYGHVQTKIHNKLSSETTEKLVHDYSNSKTAAAVHDANEPKMFNGLLGAMKMCSLCR